MMRLISHKERPKAKKQGNNKIVAVSIYLHRYNCMRPLPPNSCTFRPS